MADISGDDSKPHLIFSYGTLKQGFHNHKLTKELISQNDAVFIGPYITRHAYPLVCGPHGLPYLINLPGSGRRIRGELYAVSAVGLARFDDLEGTSIGHYERLRLQLLVNADKDGAVPVDAEAYFAHRSFGEAMWERNGKEGLTEFTENEAKRYVKRQDRPHQGRNIIEDVRRFVNGE
ncbi:PREDICTED: putative gamma-glutamylcyclotransferase At3g02910 [Fragaria vesca subsp. vesca]|uniref:putative gamma-glutamylcyclotransferase At3g02910 n=1 Tax=Fragaria vesca subsp. vesca TaxID=101020 RepID=UPI0002C34E70|nr:PREDICTED: putative gamma-glutamylcyclotransferase At3g02910 [Fragaria vesca subsp. vesca]